MAHNKAQLSAWPVVKMPRFACGLWILQHLQGSLPTIKGRWQLMGEAEKGELAKDAAEEEGREAKGAKGMRALGLV